MAHGNPQIPVTETYWTLVDKADRKFSKIRDLPYCERNRCEPSFSRVVKVYTQLWKFQQENRQKLVEAGLKRWQIGEIASRIGQLYFGQYMRTSNSDYLSESYIFYEAILSREYFKEGLFGDINVVNKQLRFLARFMMVCLVQNQRDILHLLVSQLKILVDDCIKNYQATDFKEWKVVAEEIVMFLKSDTEFMITRPLRYSYVLDPHPNSLSHSAVSDCRRLRLRDAILCSYHPNEVKFSEITIDTFRMLQCLEWEPSGSLYTSHYHHGVTGIGPVNQVQKIADLTLPPNPRKAILYRPSSTHFIAVLSMICEEMPCDGVVLIYLSNSSVNVQSSSVSSQHQDHLHISPTACAGNVGCLYPGDVLPFTRKPLFLVIDSDKSDAFKCISGKERGERAAMLLSSRCGPLASATVNGGSLFTMFLTAPLPALCFLLGLSRSRIDMVSYAEADQLLSSPLGDCVPADPVWAQILQDPFLQRLLARFLFCRNVIEHFADTFGRHECLPCCLPHLPSAFPSTLMQVASVLGVHHMFVFS